MVATARQQAHKETFQRLEPLLTQERQVFLDSLLLYNPTIGSTALNHQPLSHYWGGGNLSSSDGQRFPVAVKNRQAVALPRYFGYGRGVTLALFFGRLLHKRLLASFGLEAELSCTCIDARKIYAALLAITLDTQVNRMTSL